MSPQLYRRIFGHAYLGLGRYEGLPEKKVDKRCTKTWVRSRADRVWLNEQIKSVVG